MSRPTSYRNVMRPIDPKTCHVDFNRLEKQTKIRMARKWIETILEQKLPTHDLYSILSDGVILCKLINRLQPTIIPIIGLDGKIYSKIANIRRFLQAGNQLGLSSTELFQVYDLAEGRDMEAVVNTILALSDLNLEDLSSEIIASIDIESDLVKQRMYNSLPRPDSEQWSPNKVRRGRARGMTVSICDTEPWTGSHMSPNRLSVSRRLSTDTPIAQWTPISPQDEILDRYYYDDEPIDEKENVFDSSIRKYQPLGILQTTNIHTASSTDEHSYQTTAIDSTTSYITNSNLIRRASQDDQQDTTVFTNCIDNHDHTTQNTLSEDNSEFSLSQPNPAHTSSDRLRSQTPFETKPFHDNHNIDPPTHSLSPAPGTTYDSIRVATKTNPEHACGTPHFEQSSAPPMPLQLASLFNPTCLNTLHNSQDTEKEPLDQNFAKDLEINNSDQSSSERYPHPVPHQYVSTFAKKAIESTARSPSASVRSQISMAVSMSASQHSGSRLTRLSQLSFAKKLPSRQAVPFHMRYQEWTDQKLKKEQDGDDSPNPSLSHEISSASMAEKAFLYKFSVVSPDNPNSSVPIQGPRSDSLPRCEIKDTNTSIALSKAGPSASLSLPLLKDIPTQAFSIPNQESSYPQGKHKIRHDHSAAHHTKKVAVVRNPSLSNMEKTKSPPHSSPGTPQPLLFPGDMSLTPRRKSTGTITPPQSAEGSEEYLQLQDKTGHTVARYKLGNSIGKGHFGTVHRALDLRTGQMVAVKRIKLNVTRKEDVSDVLQEAHILQSLTHPNIVQYKGFIQTSEHINIVLEYVENGSLLSTLKAFNSFPEALVAGYCQRILEGLNYLHEQDVVHCDLKAANILTTKAGDVKLSDFGVSLNLKLKDAQAGVVAGTPNWMAPEVIELKGATTKSDIWSLGCTIIELCTGKPPYSDVNPMTALFRIVEDECPPLPESISEDLRSFLELCFQKSPMDRPTAGELLNHVWVRNTGVMEYGRRMSLASFSEGELDAIKNVRPACERIASEPAIIPGSQAKEVDLRRIPSSFPKTTRSSSLRNAASFEPLSSKSTPHKGPLSHPVPQIPSILVQKHEKHLVQRQQKEESLPKREHHFVKGSFAKSAIRCKACQLPIKQKALVCEECGFICHDKCKPESQCHSSVTYPVPEYERMGSTTSKNPEKLRPVSEPPKIKRGTFGSKTSLSSLPPRHEAIKTLQELDNKPRPTSSVSSQLRQRTQKLTRAFSSVVGHPSGHPSQSHQAKPRSARSHETLIKISEDDPTPSLSQTSSHATLGYTDQSENENNETTDTMMASRRKQRRPSDKRPSNPEDCIIS